MDIERKDTLDLYIGDFVANSAGYVRDSRRHIGESLTVALIDSALTEGFSVSGYTAWQEDGHFVTHVGAIDFDMDDGLEQAFAVRSFLGSQGMDSLLVESRRGAHLWVQSDWQPMPAATMRRALHNALVLCDVDTVKAEVFPKKSASTWGVGALRMPLMRHPKSGVTYPAYDPLDDALVTDVRALVVVMAELVTSSDALGRLAGTQAGPQTYPRHDAVWSRPTAVSGDVPSVTQLLAGLGIQARPNHSVRCPFHDDRHASLQVAADDTRAWCKAPSCELDNGGRGLGSIELEKLIRKDTRSATHP